MDSGMVAALLLNRSNKPPLSTTSSNTIHLAHSLLATYCFAGCVVCFLSMMYLRFRGEFNII